MSRQRAVNLIFMLACAALPGCSADKLSGYVDTVEWKVNNAMAQAADALGLSAPARYCVTRHAVRVRNGPGTDSPVIGAFARGETVAVEEQRRGWYRVRYKGSDGWVSARYLRDINETATSMETAHAAPATAISAPKRVEPSATKATHAVTSAKTTTVVSAKGLNTTTTQSQAGAAATTAASEAPASIEVAGIPLRWGMSKTEAAEFYAGHAQRIDASGAVWLRTAAGEGGEVPLEWFDLRFCKTGLCGVHYVLNAASVQDAGVGDQTAADLEQRYGPPADDRWTESKFGRLHVRDWRTPSARIRLSHQQDQSYATVDYEPAKDGASEHEDGGRIAREDQHGPR